MPADAATPPFPTTDDLSLRRFLIYSLILHAAVAASMIVSIVFHFQGNRWGDIGGGAEGQVNVKLVGSVGLPMPKPPDVTESKTFDPTDSLYKTQPQPKPPEPPKPEVKFPISSTKSRRSKSRNAPRPLTIRLPFPTTPSPKTAAR